jgi:hypothetical protein
MKVFLREDDEKNLEKAFSSLKWFYVFSAVITVFIVIFWILALTAGQSDMDY